MAQGFERGPVWQRRAMGHKIVAGIPGGSARGQDERGQPMVLSAVLPLRGSLSPSDWMLAPCFLTTFTSLSFGWPIFDITALLTSTIVASAGTDTCTLVPSIACVSVTSTSGLAAGACSAPPPAFSSSVFVIKSSLTCSSPSTVLSARGLGSSPSAFGEMPIDQSSGLAWPVGSVAASCCFNSAIVLPAFASSSMVKPIVRSTVTVILRSFACAGGAAGVGTSGAFAGGGGAASAASSALPMQVNSVRPLSLTESSTDW
mmetsp:Transcript_101512/g.287616  ORF Transcript_101512/g.287616 Transcript_101512/m.287616 type:complete len:259 (-) Transcript_101512:1993-2769(-)